MIVLTPKPWYHPVFICRARTAAQIFTGSSNLAGVHETMSLSVLRRRLAWHLPSQRLQVALRYAAKISKDMMIWQPFRRTYPRFPSRNVGTPSRTRYIPLQPHGALGFRSLAIANRPKFRPPSQRVLLYTQRLECSTFLGSIL